MAEAAGAATARAPVRMTARRVSFNGGSRAAGRFGHDFQPDYDPFAYARYPLERRSPLTFPCGSGNPDGMLKPGFRPGLRVYWTFGPEDGASAAFGKGDGLSGFG